MNVFASKRGLFDSFQHVFQLFLIQSLPGFAGKKRGAAHPMHGEGMFACASRLPFAGPVPMVRP
jgi:hypothetical protein